MSGRDHVGAKRTEAVHSPSPLSLFLPDDDATERVGAALASALNPGDCILLEGDLGAGKSALARAAIRALLAEDGRAEDIPSPTFTLVQVYGAKRAEVWHVDLYRLSTPEEALELGLDGAFDDAITMVEWPERLSDLTPTRRLIAHLDLPPDGDGRLLTLTAVGSGWTPALIAAKEAA